jgi:hypothetical protein
MLFQVQMKSRAGQGSRGTVYAVQCSAARRRVGGSEQLHTHIHTARDEKDNGSRARHLAVPDDDVPAAGIWIASAGSLDRLSQGQSYCGAAGSPMSTRLKQAPAAQLP